MATLTVQTADFDGVVPVYNVADIAGDEFLNDGNTFIYVKNGVTAVNITVTAQTTTANKSGFGDIAVTDTVVNVADGGPFPQVRFNDKATGRVELSYDDASNVTLAVVSIRQ
jgi:hypothetical protein